MEHGPPTRNGTATRRLPVRVALGAVVLAGATLFAACSGGSGSSDQASSEASSVQRQFVKTVRAVLPSVVEIQTEHGLGSGVVIDNEGDIVTNRHVVENSETARVRASSGKTFSATVVGTSSGNDLAVIRVQGAKLPAATLGDSSNLRVGDVVLAVGNPLGLESSVTNGIVSALGRAVDESNMVALHHLIQTSAAINPGNSGGALVDLNGRVVGIPTLAALDPEDDQAAAGIGFAIPSNTVKDVRAGLLDTGSG